MRSFLRS
jgi:hypothetical protein